MWRERVGTKINWELFDRGVEAFTWAALEELGKGAGKRGLLDDAPHGSMFRSFIEEAAHSPAARGMIAPARRAFRIAARRRIP